MMIDEKAKECPVCGYEFPSPVKLQWAAIVLLILFLLALLWKLF